MRRGIKVSILAIFGSCFAFAATAATDKVYSYLPDGTPEYCLVGVPDSPSCKAEKKANEADIARMQKELASLPDPLSPNFAHDFCVRQKAPDLDACIVQVNANRALTDAGLPSFDTDKYCSSVSDAAGGSSQIELTCRQEELKAWEWSKANIGPSKSMHYCSKVATAAGGSYQIFEACLEQESAAASQL